MCKARCRGWAIGRPPSNAPASRVSAAGCATAGMAAWNWRPRGASRLCTICASGARRGLPWRGCCGSPAVRFPPRGPIGLRSCPEDEADDGARIDQRAGGIGVGGGLQPCAHRPAGVAAAGAKAAAAGGQPRAGLAGGLRPDVADAAGGGPRPAPVDGEGKRAPHRPGSAGGRGSAGAGAARTVGGACRGRGTTSLEPPAGQFRDDATAALAGAERAAAMVQPGRPVPLRQGGCHCARGGAGARPRSAGRVRLLFDHRPVSAPAVGGLPGAGAGAGGAGPASLPGLAAGARGPAGRRGQPWAGGVPGGAGGRGAAAP